MNISTKINCLLVNSMVSVKSTLRKLPLWNLSGVLLQKLEFYGIKDAPLSWFASYLSNRKQYIDFDGTFSSYETITNGVPQGSVLGPLLFLIYMNDFGNVSKNFNFVLNADDTSLEAPLSSFECLASVSGTAVSNEINNQMKDLLKDRRSNT